MHEVLDELEDAQRKARDQAKAQSESRRMTAKGRRR